MQEPIVETNQNKILGKTFKKYFTKANIVWYNYIVND